MGVSNPDTRIGRSSVSGDPNYYGFDSDAVGGNDVSAFIGLCLGPTNAVFGLRPERGRIGTGTGSRTIGDLYPTVERKTNASTSDIFTIPDEALFETRNLGSELIDNGDFSNGLTGWTITGATGTVVNGRLRIDNLTGGTAFVRATPTTPFSNGDVVNIRYSASITSGTATRMGVGGGGYNNPADNITSSTLTDRNVIATLAGTPTVLELIIIGNSSTVVELDNVSVKDVSPINATIVHEWNGAGTTGNRTLFEYSDGTTNIRAWLATNDLNIQVGAETINLGPTFNDGGQHRIAMALTDAGRFTASVDGGVVVVRTGVTVPSVVTGGFVGQRIGATEPSTAYLDRHFWLPVASSDGQIRDASNLTTGFACGPFPNNMMFGAYSDGYSDGYYI